MTMRDKLIYKEMAKGFGVEAAKTYQTYQLTNFDALPQTAREIMATIPPVPGACAILSAVWVSILNERFGIPAIAVAGEIKVGNARMFHCKKNIPINPMLEEDQFQIDWKGHCWVEVDDYIGDLSLFRTAYALDKNTYLRSFIETNFGSNRGALIFPSEQKPTGLSYKPKYVLDRPRLNMLTASAEVLRKMRGGESD